jgi:hypothetical protein
VASAFASGGLFALLMSKAGVLTPTLMTFFHLGLIRLKGFNCFGLGAEGDPSPILDG